MAQELMNRGWKNVRVLEGGFDAARRGGLPIRPKHERLTTAQAAENLRKSEGDQDVDV